MRRNTSLVLYTIALWGFAWVMAILAIMLLVEAVFIGV